MPITPDDTTKQYITTSAVNELLKLVQEKINEKQKKLTEAQLSAIDSVASGAYIPYSAIGGTRI